MPHPIPATLQAALDHMSATRARMAKRAPRTASAPQEPRPDWPQRLNRPVQIGEIPGPWWNRD